MSSTPSPYVAQSFKFTGSSSNIVKDHFIEKQSLSRRASQQFTNIMMKNRTRSKFHNVLKSFAILSLIILFYIQFQQGSSVNQLIHNIQDGMINQHQFKSTTASASSRAPGVLTITDFTLKQGQFELLDDLLNVVKTNAPVLQDEPSIDAEAANFLIQAKKNDQVLTEQKLLDNHLIKLNEQQVDSLLLAHSNFVSDLYTQMHNLIKMLHSYFDYGQDGVVIYNSINYDLKESIIASRLSIDSLLKTSTSHVSLIQIVFHALTEEDKQNQDLMKLCSLNKVECISLKQEFETVAAEEGQATEILIPESIVNDSLLKKLTVLLSNKLDNLLVVDSGTIFLNNIDELMTMRSLNSVFWSETEDKRLTSPLYYDIANKKNIYGNKRERVRVNKDDTFKYFQISEEDKAKEVPFHDLEDTMVDSTTDSSVVFINKKTNLDVLALSLYYDFYQEFYYPLLMAMKPDHHKVETTDQDAEHSQFFSTKSHASNSFSETLFASAFALNSKHHQVTKKQTPLNNGYLNFDPVQDMKSLKTYYKEKLRKLLPNSLSVEINVYDKNQFSEYINSEAEIKPTTLCGIDLKEIFNKDKFFKSVFEHDFYLNNNEVDPDIIVSDLFLSLKSIF